MCGKSKWNINICTKKPKITAAFQDPDGPTCVYKHGVGRRQWGTERHGRKRNLISRTLFFFFPPRLLKALSTEREKKRVWGITKDSKLLQNKNRLRSKTCGGDEKIGTKPKLSQRSGDKWQHSQECWIPPKDNRTEVKQKEICWIEDCTLKCIYEVKILYIQLIDNCAMFRQTAPPLTTRLTPLTILGPDGFAAGKNAKKQVCPWMGEFPCPPPPPRGKHRVWGSFFPPLGSSYFLSPPLLSPFSSSFSIRLSPVAFPTISTGKKGQN